MSILISGLVRSAVVVGCACLVLLVCAGAASAATQSFANPTPLKIPGSGTKGPANVYPSEVVASGMPGPITGVNVTVHRLGHTRPMELDLLLVSPAGEAVILMSGNCGIGDIEDFTWIFDQQAPNPMPRGTDSPCPDFVYRPSVNSDPNPLPAPAPAGPYRKTLNAFTNDLPNGTWKLFVADTEDNDTGDVELGWTLTLSTREPDATIPATGTFGIANPYPATTTVSGQQGVITDVDVSVDGIWHQRPDDLDVLLVGPRGQSAVLASDVCGTFTIAAYGWIWDDEAPGGPMPDGDATNACTQSRYRPTDLEVGDAWPAPAPASPHASRLSAFDFTDPNGEWRLYASDDSSGATGFLTNRFQVNVGTRPAASVAFADGQLTVGEGATRAVTITRSGEELPVGPGEVTVTSVPATATSPEDYSPIAEIATFGPGELSKTVTVNVAADGDRELAETFALTLSAAGGDARIGTPSSVAITIPGPPTPQPSPTPSPDPVTTPAPDPVAAAISCAGKRATIVGTPGRDVLRGTRSADVIVGLGGNDVIRAVRGNDTVCGGAGRDRISGGAGRDRCLGGPGRDRTRCERRS